jgi:hypothetical protein
VSSCLMLDSQATRYSYSPRTRTSARGRLGDAKPPVQVLPRADVPRLVDVEVLPQFLEPVHLLLDGAVHELGHPVALPVRVWVTRDPGHVLLVGRVPEPDRGAALHRPVPLARRRRVALCLVEPQAGQLLLHQALADVHVQSSRAGCRWGCATCTPGRMLSAIASSVASLGCFRACSRYFSCIRCAATRSDTVESAAPGSGCLRRRQAACTELRKSRSSTHSQWPPSAAEGFGTQMRRLRGVQGWSLGARWAMCVLYFLFDAWTQKKGPLSPTSMGEKPAAVVPSHPRMLFDPEPFHDLAARWRTGDPLWDQVHDHDHHATRADPHNRTSMGPRACNRTDPNPQPWQALEVGVSTL